MAYPRLFATLLVLPVFFLLSSYPVRGHTLEGSCEAASLEDQDDTGLMQAPVRQTVEVTKVRKTPDAAKPSAAAAKPSMQLAEKAPEDEVTQVRETPDAAKPSVVVATAPAKPSMQLSEKAPEEEVTQVRTTPDAVKPSVVVATAPAKLAEKAQEEEVAMAASKDASSDAGRTSELQHANALEPEKQLEKASAEEELGQISPEDSHSSVPLTFLQLDEVETANQAAPPSAEVSQAASSSVAAETSTLDTPEEGAVKLLEAAGEIEKTGTITAEKKDGEDDTNDNLEPTEEAAVEAEVADEVLPEDMIQVADEVVPGSQDTGAALRFKFGQLLLIFVAVALVMHFMFQWRASASLPRDALSAKMRRKLESLPLATGPEIRFACALDGATSPTAGAPMRIQGKVVSKLTGPLTAPLSGRSCVLYSASVSKLRQDGVHQPPVAFGSAHRDFAVQLDDCPEMLLEINSQDVFPFDMEGGRYACELAFGDSPDTWRSFMLGNLTPGVEGCGANAHSMNRVDLGDKGPLNFRECALVEGSRVTCIGEVIREHNGKLRLCPWSPSTIPDAGDVPKSTGMKWLKPEAEPWLHKLMISDDSRLLKEAPLLLPGKCRSCS